MLRQNNDSKKKVIYNPIKRYSDFILAIIAVIILSPIMLIIAISIKFTSKGPVFFKQKRAGINSKPFYIYKFRTMKNDSPILSTEEFVDCKSYITSVGKLLRRTSLDEIPQFLNVIKGEISLVGPRPIMLEEKDLIELRKEKGVDCVRPGITGFAQINGRDNISVEEKVSYDEIYVSKASILFDIKILFVTVLKVIKRDGIVS